MLRFIPIGPTPLLKYSLSEKVVEVSLQMVIPRMVSQPPLLLAWLIETALSWL
jgi:hypothetical protein